METRLEFEDEIPIPLGNLGLYRRIYVLEQWLRRFAMAVLMSKYATQWRSAIPTEFGEELRRRRKQLGSRTYLDVESNDNVVWLLTLEELRRLLLSDFLWPSVKQLTGLQKADVASRVEELREIRNVIGHNRATTGQTARIFEGIEGYLGSGVERFRQESGSDRGGSSDFPRVRPPARTRTRRALPRRALLRPRLRRAPV